MGNRFYKTPATERFWPKVAFAPGDHCWVWNGYRDKKGYGQFNKGRRSGLVKAHRQSWELTHGPIPDGLCVLHRCDNPSCVRPTHLFLGTLSDNTQDMLSKGRSVSQTRPELHVRGEAHKSAKLSRAKIQEIKKLRADGMTQTELARRFSVTQAAIWYVLNDRTWQPARAKQLVVDEGRGQVKASAELFA